MLKKLSLKKIGYFSTALTVYLASMLVLLMLTAAWTLSYRKTKYTGAVEATVSVSEDTKPSDPETKHIVLDYMVGDVAHKKIMVVSSDFDVDGGKMTVHYDEEDPDKICLINDKQMLKKTVTPILTTAVLIAIFTAVFALLVCKFKLVAQVVGFLFILQIIGFIFNVNTIVDAFDVCSMVAKVHKVD